MAGGGSFKWEAIEDGSGQDQTRRTDAQCREVGVIAGKRGRGPGSFSPVGPPLTCEKAEEGFDPG